MEAPGNALPNPRCELKVPLPKSEEERPGETSEAAMPSSPVVLVGRGGVVVILRTSFPEAFLQMILISIIEEEKERRRPLSIYKLSLPNY